MKRVSLLACQIAWLVLLTGCPVTTPAPTPDATPSPDPTPTDPNMGVTDPGPTPSNPGVEPGPTPPPPAPELTLSDAQRGAINQVAARLTEAAAVFSAMTPLTDSTLDIDTIGTLGSSGSCPQLSFVSTDEVAVIRITYPAAGCTPAYTSAGLAGAVDLRVQRGSRSAFVEFAAASDNLVVSGEAVAGESTLTVTETADGVALSGDIAFTVDGRSFIGGISVGLTPAGVTTMNSPSLTVEAGGEVLAVTFEGLVVDGATNGNLTPQAGVVSFTSGGEALRVTFGGTSPATRSATVRQGDASGTVQITSE